jgi:hypothetical protein
MTIDGEDIPRKQTALRVVCECGGELGFVVLPGGADAIAFVATCPGCGTRYRRPMPALVNRAQPNETVLVRLPRSRPIE